MGLAICDADTAFADVICADPQWLREEFDALIAASFSEPPARPPLSPPRVPPRPGPWWLPPGPWPGRLPVVLTSPHAAPGHGHQRSPPA